LDLSAAFDCVDHEILLSRVQSMFGLGGAALAWIRSFLSDRAQRFSACLSSVLLLMYGVPQGSVIGPLLFLLYAAKVFEISSLRFNSLVTRVLMICLRRCRPVLALQAPSGLQLGGMYQRLDQCMAENIY